MWWNKIFCWIIFFKTKTTTTKHNQPRHKNYPPSSIWPKLCKTYQNVLELVQTQRFTIRSVYENVVVRKTPRDNHLNWLSRAAGYRSDCTVLWYDSTELSHHCAKILHHKIQRSWKIFKHLIGSCRARLDNRKCLRAPNVYITWYSKIQKCSYFLKSPFSICCLIAPFWA